MIVKSDAEALVDLTETTVSALMDTTTAAQKIIAMIDEGAGRS